jgi:hypothetical protein
MTRIISQCVICLQHLVSILGGNAAGFEGVNQAQMEQVHEWVGKQTGQQRVKSIIGVG